MMFITDAIQNLLPKDSGQNIKIELTQKWLEWDI